MAPRGAAKPAGWNRPASRSARAAIVLGLAVAAVLTLVISGALARQAQLSADRRLADGATAARSLLSISGGALDPDSRQLDRFKTSSGLDVSLSLDGTWAATTLRRRDGTPLAGGQADPATYRDVVELGRSRFDDWKLRGGTVRAYSVPLADAGGARIGMLSVTLPQAAIEADPTAALLATLPLVALVALATAGFAFFLLLRWQRPVRALAAAAARLSNGDFTTPIPTVTDPGLAVLAEELDRARGGLQESLRAAALEETHLRAIFAALPQPVLVTGPDGRVSDSNLAALQFFGVDGFGRRPIRQLLPAVQPRLGDERQTVAWRGSVIDARGVAVDVEILRARFAGLSTRDVYVVQDVSRLAELNRLREQLLYNVAHELRAPLGILENLFEILGEDYTNLSLVEVDRLLGSGRRTAARIRRLMEDLLSAGSIESGNFNLNCQPTPVSAIIGDGVEAVEGMLNERGQRVAVEISPPDLCALADQSHASRVVANLVSNASKYGPEDESIRIGAERVNGHVRITVADAGPGIPADQRMRLFEHFYRLRSHAEAPGIGLGLAIARGIVELHGGMIGIENGEQQGARVWFTLPAVEANP